MRVVIGPSIGPLTQAGLYEALGLAVGTWCVGSGVVMTERELCAGAGKVTTPIDLGVVGVNTLDAYTQPRVIGNRSPQEGHRTPGILIGQQLCIGHARSVIDGDVQILPSRRRSAAMPCTIPADAVANLQDAA